MPVILFSDGLSVAGGKVRKWDETKCVKFVADIMDGFFPGEFKNQYPDGVKLDLYDRRESESGDNVRVFEGEGKATGAIREEGADGKNKPASLASIGEIRCVRRASEAKRANEASAKKSWSCPTSGRAEQAGGAASAPTTDAYTTDAYNDARAGR